jgi:hypothetical protein
MIGCPDVPSSGVTGWEMNQRGGRLDIEDKPGKSKIEEASEESFPASDPTSFTPDGYINCPPPCRK